MKKDGKFRFTLQFGSESESQIRAGELLEKLGNKKSAVVVAALNNYIIAHPELLNDTLKITIKHDNAIRKNQLEELIRKIVEDKLAQVGEHSRDALEENAPPSPLVDDIAQMVSNLDLFN